MKNKYLHFSLIVAAIATLAVGCQKDTDTVTLGAEIQQTVSGNAKVYINDHTPCWHNGDEVYINNAAYPVMAASGSSARIENVVSSSSYRAIFPASIVPEGYNISSSSSVPVALPSVQHYELVNGHQRVDVPMGAYITSGSTLQFYNLCSVVRVTVSNSLNQDLTLRRIELTAAGSGLSGAGTATVSCSVNDHITMSSTASHSVTLSFGGNSTTTVGALATETFDIVVPEFGTDDVTIKVYTTDGMYSEVEKENVTLAHNTITTVTANVTNTNLTEVVAAELVDGSTFRLAIHDATSIVFEYNSSVNTGTLLSTASSPVPIYGNMDGTVLRVSTSASVINANPDCSYMMAGYSSLLTIDFGEGFNTSNVTNMEYMFNNCNYLTSLDFSSFNTLNVTSMVYMFGYCSRLTYLNLSSFNTSNVTNMGNMFWFCSDLTSLNLSSFNTSNVTNMSGMFSGCSRLTNLDLSNFNTSNVTSMSLMFWDCIGLRGLNISSFNTSNVIRMSEMFRGCSSLTSLNLSSFNTSSVTDIYGMFRGCSSLTSLNLSSFNTSSVRDMSYMFNGCSGLASLNLSNFNMSNVTDKSYMCSNLSTTSGYCYITCPSSVETAMRSGASLPTSGVTFTWVRP